MDKILKICSDIEKHIPDNRIDGVFVGERYSLYVFLLKKIEVGWHICLTGDIFDNGQKFLKDGIYYYAKVTHEIKQGLLSLLDNSFLETFYIFDENYNPVILIDDFPEDVTICIDIC